MTPTLRLCQSLRAGQGTGKPEVDLETQQVEKWVRASQRGDRAAFANLYERYAPLVNAVLLARVPPQDVEDLKQEVFMTAMQRLDSLRNAEGVGSWLAGIARHRAADLHRSSRGTEQLTPEIPDTRHPGADIDGQELLARIRRLPEAYRETLILRFVEGMTGPEISAQLGLTHGSVRVNLCRGVALLREGLTPNRPRDPR